MDAQHQFERPRWPAASAFVSRFMVMGPDLFHQALPGNERIHFLKKDFTAGLALFQTVLPVQQAPLVHAYLHLAPIASTCHVYSTTSD